MVKKANISREEFAQKLVDYWQSVELPQLDFSDEQAHEPGAEEIMQELSLEHKNAEEDVDLDFELGRLRDVVKELWGEILNSVSVEVQKMFLKHTDNLLSYSDQLNEDDRIWLMEIRAEILHSDLFLAARSAGAYDPYIL